MLLTRIALISLSQETEHGAMNEYASPGCCDAVMLDLKQGVWLSHLVEAYRRPIDDLYRRAGMTMMPLGFCGYDCSSEPIAIAGECG